MEKQGFKKYRASFDFKDYIVHLRRQNRDKVIDLWTSTNFHVLCSGNASGLLISSVWLFYPAKCVLNLKIPDTTVIIHKREMYTAIIFPSVLTLEEQFVKVWAVLFWSFFQTFTCLPSSWVCPVCEHCSFTWTPV